MQVATKLNENKWEFVFYMELKPSGFDDLQHIYMTNMFSL